MKNPQKRPAVKDLLDLNSELFLKVKEKSYLKETLLNGVKPIVERVNFFVIFQIISVKSLYEETNNEEVLYDNKLKLKINWKFDCLIDYQEYEDNASTVSNINSLRSSCIGETEISQNSNNLKESPQLKLIKTTSSISSLSLQADKLSNLKVKMNPEIEEAMIRSSKKNVNNVDEQYFDDKDKASSKKYDKKSSFHNHNHNHNYHEEKENIMHKKNKNATLSLKLNSIKKCFDEDEDDDNE